MAFSFVGHTVLSFIVFRVLSLEFEGLDFFDADARKGVNALGPE